MIIAYKYKMKPTVVQSEYFSKCFGCMRYVYNYALSWSSFVRMLEYKSEWYGVNLLKAGRFDPTSQTCSVCGYRNNGTKDLSVREWTCPECGTHHDRDINAAINIMNAAIERHFNEQGPAVTGITDADGVDSESKTETSSQICNYASDETSMQNVLK